MSITSLTQLLQARRIVVKIGSSLLVEDGDARAHWLHMLVQDLWAISAEGPEIVVVSSGAIALGAAKLGLPHGGRGSLADAQASAAVGQIALARLWSESFAEFGQTAAQVLLTIDDLEDRRRYLNAAATFDRLIAAGVVPVVNENDTVATEEIRFGDNDRLAARVAQACGADLVMLLSDVDGLYDRDPAQHGARLIRQVDGITPEILAMASASSSSGMGSGGMVSKLQAAQIAERAGIALAIINGKWESPLAVAVDSDLGTLFLPQRHDGARKAWLGGRQRMAGALVVDAGCAKALGAGNSLLSSGIVSVDGTFERGDPIGVRDEQGRPLAQGLSEYASGEIERIKGLRSEEHEALLGYAPRSAVIHRNHMVLL